MSRARKPGTRVETITELRLPDSHAGLTWLEAVTQFVAVSSQMVTPRLAMDLALFDFDGTITLEGTYPGFLRFAVRPGRKFIGSIILSPLILAYRGRLVSDAAIRKVLSRVAFWREEPDRLRWLGERYAREVLPGLIRPMALERIEWHKARGDLVVVVSASLDVYLEPWCRSLGVEVICTQLEASNGRTTGKYVRGDCFGEAKATRIRERYPLADYRTVYAYGDTEDDRHMLEMADKRFFRWEEVRDVPVVSR